MFRVDRRALMSKTGLGLTGLVLIFGVLILFFAECSRSDRFIAEADVWKVVQIEAAKHDLDPRFVFAIVAAESSFNAHAENGDARGLMQLRPIAWREVSSTSHRNAWRWRKNIEVGTSYLGFLKEFLQEEGAFSYPALAACYRHGPYRVKGVDFRLDELPTPRNRIYRELHRGNLAAVPLPEMP